MDMDFSMAMMTMFGEASRVMFDLRVGVRPDHITQGQYNIMEYVFFHIEGTTVSSISECLFMSMPNTSREIKKLIEMGYLLKVQNKGDKRRYHIMLSANGKKLMDEVFMKVFSRSDERYAHLTQEEMKDLTKQLKTITEKLFY